MSAKVIRCSECNRRARSGAGWNCTMRSGVMAGYLCPTCQTPEQNAEAEINAATLNYGVDPAGRFVGTAASASRGVAS